MIFKLTRKLTKWLLIWLGIAAAVIGILANWDPAMAMIRKLLS